MHVSTVCKYNQARSIIAAAAIRAIFPEITVTSSGVQAMPTTIPQQIRDIAQAWNLPIQESVSTSAQAAKGSLDSSDLIIAADEEVAFRLGETTNNPSIVNLQALASALEFTPHDPTGMQTGQMEIELAKVVALTIQQIITFLNLRSTHEISVVIPRSPEAEGRAIAIAQDNIKNGGTIVDLNLRFPDSTIWKNGATPLMLIKGDYVGELASRAQEFCAIDPVSSSNVQSMSSVILAPAYELTSPESLWLNRTVINALLKLSEVAPVTVMTAPLTIAQKTLPDAYFGAICASRVDVIS